MCLGVPGRILSIEPGELRTGNVAFGGVTRSVCLVCVPEADVGEYVIVHAGMAIARLDPEAAQRTLELFDEARSLLSSAEPPSSSGS
jgi:hydrogenase expression/formation protein HypC